MAATTQETSTDALLTRVAQLEGALSAERAALLVERWRTTWRFSARHERLRQEFELVATASWWRRPSASTASGGT
jgi:hypothetical protein